MTQSVILFARVHIINERVTNNISTTKNFGIIFRTLFRKLALFLILPYKFIFFLNLRIHIIRIEINRMEGVAGYQILFSHISIIIYFYSF